MAHYAPEFAQTPCAASQNTPKQIERDFRNIPLRRQRDSIGDMLWDAGVNECKRPGIPGLLEALEERYNNLPPTPETIEQLYAEEAFIAPTAYMLGEPCTSTDIPAGSDRKIKLLQERFERGEQLHSPRDSKHIEDRNLAPTEEEFADWDD